MKSFNTVPESSIRAIYNLGRKLPNCEYEQSSEIIEDILGYKKTEGSKPVWNEQKAKKYFSGLTKLQKVVLNHLHTSTNTQLPDILNNVKKNGYPTANSYTIAGTTSGLTKKCQKLGLTPVYKAKQVDNQWIYTIADDAASFIHFLNN